VLNAVFNLGQERHTHSTSSGRYFIPTQPLSFCKR